MRLAKTENLENSSYTAAMINMLCMIYMLLAGTSRMTRKYLREISGLFLTFHIVADQDGKQKHAELGDDIAGI